MKRVAVAVLAVAGVLGVTGVAIARERSQALNDATIVAIFDEANTADIETGALAAERGTAKEVRDFGTMLSQVHTQVRKKGRELAQQLGVTPTPPSDDQGARDHAVAMAKLQALHGAEFDKAFLQHEEAYHAAVLSAVKGTLLPAIQNKELKDFVTSLAPAFEGHRQAAVNLQKQLGFAR